MTNRTIWEVNSLKFDSVNSFVSVLLFSIGREIRIINKTKRVFLSCFIVNCIRVVIQ